MGLLDDAIREHLELKRRHGADPTEVERQEQEALGPARRGAAVDELEPFHAGAVSLDLVDDDPATLETEPAEVPGALAADADVAHGAPPEPQPADAARGEDDADDVLGETPEFLQETPEHDRLWFEQKPP